MLGYTQRHFLIYYSLYKSFCQLDKWIYNKNSAPPLTNGAHTKCKRVLSSSQLKLNEHLDVDIFSSFRPTLPTFFYIKRVTTVVDLQCPSVWLSKVFQNPNLVTVVRTKSFYLNGKDLLAALVPPFIVIIINSNVQWTVLIFFILFRILPYVC